MPGLARVLGLVLLSGLWLKPAAAAGIDVAVSIKPIHALVSGVMAGVGSPYLIVKGAESPHGYSLKPSDAQALAKAKVVFWVGEDLERFLEQPIHSLARDAEIVWMLDAPGITRLETREGDDFDVHEEHRDSASGHTGHEGHEGHDHGSIDMHLWLDPDNAKAMVRTIAQSLREADPEHAAVYAANADKLVKKLDELDQELATMLAPLKGAKFIVFHDSYQYFEMRYRLPASGSITINPDIPPGARRVRKIREKIKKSGARCVFSEPQFNSRIVDVVTEGLDAKVGIFDPIGAALDEGPDLYFTLLRNIAKAMAECLGKSR